MATGTHMSYLEFLLKILQMSEKLLSWRTLSLISFVTSALLLFGQISFVRIILNPMYTTLRLTIAWAWVLSIIGISFKCLLCLYYRIERNVLDSRARRKAQEQLQKLSVSEREILRYVSEYGGCGVWVGESDAAVQTLLHKGLLERVAELREKEYWYKKGYSDFCILVQIAKNVEFPVRLSKS